MDFRSSPGKRALALPAIRRQLLANHLHLVWDR
jgi:hypothetical protein